MQPKKFLKKVTIYSYVNDVTSKYNAELRVAKENPLKSFITHPLKVLNSRDDILHPAGNGL